MPSNDREQGQDGSRVDRGEKMRRPESVLRDGADTYAEKNEDYGASWYAIGEVLYQMAGGEDVTLSTPEDWVKVGLYTRRLDKMFRSFNGELRGDERDDLNFESVFDTHADESVYAAMAATVAEMEMEMETDTDTDDEGESDE